MSIKGSREKTSWKILVATFHAIWVGNGCYMTHCIIVEYGFCGCFICQRNKLTGIIVFCKTCIACGIGYPIYFAKAVVGKASYCTGTIDDFHHTSQPVIYKVGF